MKINQKYLLLAFEALIPILGFFLWDWGLYFILLFYFLDMIAQEFIMFLKTKKIKETQSLDGKKSWFRYGILSLVVLFGLLLVIHVAMMSIQPNIDFFQQAKDFWNYEDLGIKQGYVLIPLVVLGAFQQYKMSFLMRGLDHVLPLKVVWKDHIQALFIAIGFAGIAFGVSQFIILPEVVYFLSIVAGIGVYGYIFKK